MDLGVGQITNMMSPILPCASKFVYYSTLQRPSHARSLELLHSRAQTGQLKCQLAVAALGGKHHDIMLKVAVHQLKTSEPLRPNPQHHTNVHGASDIPSPWTEGLEARSRTSNMTSLNILYV